MGMRFLRSAGMEGSTGNLHEFLINPANTAKIFTGDLVLISAGYVIEASIAASNNDFTTIGVFEGCQYVDADGSYKFRQWWDGAAGRTNIRAKVSGGNDARFLIPGQAGATYTQADIGTRKGIIYVAGNQANGESNITLGAPGATVATGPLLIHSKVDFADGKNWFEVSLVRDALEYKVA